MAKRQYVRDLIKIDNRDIDASMKTHRSSMVDAFDSRSACPIIKGLRRHGHTARFSAMDGDIQRITIDGTKYRVPKKMVDWLNNGMFDGPRPRRISFRISELTPV